MFNNRVEEYCYINNLVYIKPNNSNSINNLLFKNIIDKDNDSLEYKYYLACYYLASSKYELALVIFKSNDNHNQSLIMLGRYYAKNNNKDLAIEYINRAIKNGYIDGYIDLASIERQYNHENKAECSKKVEEYLLMADSAYGYFVLANYYGVDSDNYEKYMIKSFKLGNVLALHNLIMYLERQKNFRKISLIYLELCDDLPKFKEYLLYHSNIHQAILPK